jgi:hypothetical protein
VLHGAEEGDVPYECPPIGHSAHSADGSAHAWEPEGAAWLEQGFVQAVFVDCAVASVVVSMSTRALVIAVQKNVPPRVDEVPVRAPARIHTPRRCASRGRDARDGRRLAAVPDGEHAVDGGGEEGGFGARRE